jgi:predicted phage terminase large subunit-like protein
LYKAIESGAWQSSVFPICEEFPCSREDFRPAWGERFTYDFLMEEYEAAKKEGQVAAFYQELMLKITSEEDRLVPDEDILWYSRKDVLRYRENHNFYITTDFATSASRSADYSAISVWALNSQGHWFWVDGMLNKQTMDLNLNELFRLAHKYSPMSVGIETNGQQGGFIPWIQQEMHSRGIYFNLAKTRVAKGKATKIGIHSPTNSNKLDRFMLMLPMIKQGKLWLPEELKDGRIMKEAVTELKGVVKKGMTSRHDDWLDTLSQIGLMETWTPSESLESQYKEEEDDSEYSRYWGHHGLLRSKSGYGEDDSERDNYIV